MDVELFRKELLQTTNNNINILQIKDKDKIYNTFDNLFNKYQDSIIVVSYNVISYAKGYRNI